MRSARLLPMGRRRLARWAARALGAVEVALGVVGLFVALSSEIAATLHISMYLSTAVLFAGFNLFLLRLNRIDASADCGCFGGAELGGSAAGRWHLRLNSLTAGSAGVVAVLAVVAPDLLEHASLVGTLTEMESVLLSASYLALVLTLAWVMAVGPGLMDQLGTYSAAQDRTVSP